MTAPKTTAVLEHTDVELRNTHVRAQCQGQPCTIHHRSKHAMRAFPQRWNPARAIVERVCPHGYAHPDPDEWAVRVGHDAGEHRCDGCCGSTAEVIS